MVHKFSRIVKTHIYAFRTNLCIGCFYPIFKVYGCCMVVARWTVVAWWEGGGAVVEEERTREKRRERRKRKGNEKLVQISK